MKLTSDCISIRGSFNAKEFISEKRNYTAANEIFAIHKQRAVVILPVTAYQRCLICTAGNAVTGSITTARENLRPAQPA